MAGGYYTLILAVISEMRRDAPRPAENFNRAIY